MIMEKESEIKVLRNFYENPFDYFSIAEISKKTKISRNWIYKIIEKFENNKILSTDGKRYKLDFSNLFCKRIKLLFDSDYLINLKQKIRENIFNIINKMIFEMSPLSIILVGSVAVNKQKKNSDIDFIVISKEKKIPYFKNCNIILLTEDELKDKYLKGDDFIISALLFGKIIMDKDIFIKFFEKPLPILSEELIQEKIKYCERLEERIYALLKSDVETANDELLHLILQFARIILIRNRIIPKTKHDIAAQIKPFNKKIAEMIDELFKNKLDKKRILEYINLGKESI